MEAGSIARNPTKGQEAAGTPAVGGGAPKSGPSQAQAAEKRKKESIVDLSKYMDKGVRVKFQGGREATGILKGYDPLLNLVLDNTKEFLRDPDDPFKITDNTRELGLVVCKGPAVVVICPVEGMEQIPNPFISHDWRKTIYR